MVSLSCLISLRSQVQEGNHSSMWAISQGRHATEIAHFERSSLESRLLEGEKGIAYWCMATITLLLPLCFSYMFPFFLSKFPIFSLIFHSFVSLVFLLFLSLVFSFPFLCSPLLPLTMHS